MTKKEQVLVSLKHVPGYTKYVHLEQQEHRNKKGNNRKKTRRKHKANKGKTSKIQSQHNQFKNFLSECYASKEQTTQRTKN